MKLKTLALGLLATILAAPSLLADVNIYITGSTAFRSAAYTSIYSLFDPTPSVAADNSTVTSGNHQTISGTITSLYGGSTTVNVYLSWNGSVEGIQAVTSGANQTYLPVGTVQSTNNNTYSVSGPSDFAFSDVFQKTTAYTSPTLVEHKTGTGSTIPGVAVVPFTFVRSVHTSSANLTNISHQQAQTLLAAGQVSLRFWTGNSGDASTLVSLCGRYNLSGTRYSVQAEVGAGARFVSDNWQLVSGTWTDFGDAGYASGSGIKGDLNNATSSGPAIGYLGISDANGVNSGANYISYEGVPYSVAAVQEGKYALWGYEHFYWNSSNSSATDSNHISFRTALFAAFPSNLGVAGITTTSMNVSRAADGGKIAPIY